MSKGKVWRAERHVKEVLSRLEDFQARYVLRQLQAWINPKPEHNRLSVAERIRFKWWLWWKYGPECAYCHKGYDWRYALTLDHIQPVSRGGALRDIRNMVLACRGCNREKGNTWL